MSRRSKWISGECYAFAVALHELTGWRPVLFTADDDPVHAALRHPDGGFADAEGRITLEKLRLRYGAPHLRVERSKIPIETIRFFAEARDIAAARAAIRGYAARGDAFFAALIVHKAE